MGASKVKKSGGGRFAGKQRWRLPEPLATVRPLSKKPGHGGVAAKRRGGVGCYELRQFKDPRLGEAKAAKDFYLFQEKEFEKNKEEEEKRYQADMRRAMLRKGKYEQWRKLPLVNAKITGFLKNEMSNLRKFKKELKEESPLIAKKQKEDQMRYYENWEKNEEKILREIDTKCAEAALASYNKEHSTDYELVETLITYHRAYVGIWYHCNFKAKRKTGTSSARPPLPKLFFAELKNHRKKLTVESCCILGPRTDTVVGCEMCPSLILHPINGCKVGCPGMNFETIIA